MKNYKDTILRIVDASSVSTKDLIEIFHESSREKINVLLLDEKNNSFTMTCFKGENSELPEFDNYMLSGNIKLPEYESIEEEILSMKYSLS